MSSLLDLFNRRPRHIIMVSVPDGLNREPATCEEVDSHRRSLEMQLDVANGRIASLEGTIDHMKRAQGNALLIAFNGGPRFAEFLKEINSPAVPVLGTDGRTVVVEFTTLTITFAPFEEKMHVHIVGDTKTQVFDAPDGELSTGDRQLLPE